MGWALGAVLLWGGFGSTVPTAHAQGTGIDPSQLSPRDARLWGHRQDVQSWLARDAQTASTPPPGFECTQVCDDLYLSEHRPMPSQPSSRSMWRNLRREIEKARVRARFRLGLKTLGPIAVGVEAGAIGWKIGGAIADKLFPRQWSQPNAGMESAVVGPWEPIEKGEVIVSATYQAGEQRVLAPEDGWTAAITPGNWQEGVCWGGPPALPGFVDAAGNPSEIARVVTATIAANSTSCDPNHDGEMDGPFPNVNVAGRAYTENVPLPTVTKPAGDPDPDGYTSQGTAPSIPSWPTQEQAQSAIEDMIENPDEYPTLKPWLDSNFPDGDTEDPLVPKVEVPHCAGLSYAECAGILTDLELVPVKTTLTDAEADLLKPPATVVETRPVEGARVSTGTEVDVRVNPDVLPLSVPAPVPGETYPDYITRLQNEGLVGRAVELVPELIDATKGPNEVVRVEPQPGTRVQPGTEVIVRHNPADAPVPDPGAGSCGPTVPGLDLSPLMVGLGDRFPFGVFGWLRDTFGGWTGSGSAPVFSFPLPFNDEALRVDLGPFADPVMAVVRPVLLVCAMVGLAWLFAASALGFGRGGGD